MCIVVSIPSFDDSHIAFLFITKQFYVNVCVVHFRHHHHNDLWCFVNRIHSIAKYLSVIRYYNYAGPFAQTLRITPKSNPNWDSDIVDREKIQPDDVIDHHTHTNKWCILFALPDWHTKLCIFICNPKKTALAFSGRTQKEFTIIIVCKQRDAKVLRFHAS